MGHAPLLCMMFVLRCLATSCNGIRAQSRGRCLNKLFTGRAVGSYSTYVLNAPRMPIQKLWKKQLQRHAYVNSYVYCCAFGFNVMFYAVGVRVLHWSVHAQDIKIS